MQGRYRAVCRRWLALLGPLIARHQVYINAVFLLGSVLNKVSPIREEERKQHCLVAYRRAVASYSVNAGHLTSFKLYIAL